MKKKVKGFIFLFVLFLCFPNAATIMAQPNDQSIQEQVTQWGNRYPEAATVLMQLIAQTQQNNEWRFQAQRQAIAQSIDFMPAVNKIQNQFAANLQALMQQGYNWEYVQYPQEGAKFTNIIQMHTADFIRFVNDRTTDARNKKLDMQGIALKQYLEMLNH
jgi:hypothetical protein